MERVVSYLCKLRPEMFCEVDPELAAERRARRAARPPSRPSGPTIEAR